MKMRKNIYKVVCLRFIFFALLCVSSSSLYAHPFLWQVTGEHNFYLFGTIHLPDPRVTELTPEVEEAIKDSTDFYAELDLSESNTMEITQSMWLPKRKTLHDILPKPLKSQINEYLHTINPDLNLEFFSKQKIWVLAVTLTVLEQQLKYPGQPPLDRALFQKATSLGLDTGGLETVNDQLGIFEDLSDEEQITFLKDTVEFLQSDENKNNGFVENSLLAYIRGDLEVLMGSLMSYMKDDLFYDELLEELIDKRNFRMTDTIISLVSKNPQKRYFFAIGAGHFWGETSINNLLKKRGYSIKLVD